MTSSFSPIATVLPEVSGNNSDIATPKKFNPVPKPVELVSPVDGPLPPVQEIDDDVKIDPAAQSIADLQALLEKLKNAKGGEQIGEALRSLQDFILEKTNASFTGGVFEKLASLAETVLKQLEEDPKALGDVVSFGFSFNFSQTERLAGNAYSQETSFSYSFNLITEDTAFRASGGFSSSLHKTPGAISYSSEEYATVSIRTTLTSVEENPILQAYNELSGFLQQTQAPQILGIPEEITFPLPKPAQLVGLLGGLKAQFAALDDARRHSVKALDILQDVLEKLRERFAASHQEIPTLENAAAA